MGSITLSLKRNTVFALGLLLIVVAVVGSGLSTTFAQQAPSPGSGQALEISPTLVTLDADPGENLTLEVRLRNVSDEPLVVSGEINDFVAGDEQGAPRVVMEEDMEEFGDNPYSLRDWVDSVPEMLLEPGDIETLTATISVPNNASPGGHYGIIRFSGTPPELEDTGVSLAASVGTLVLLTVSGDISESAEVEEFVVMKDGETSGMFESQPLQLVQRIRNTGNVHVRVQGQVFIKDMFDRDLAAANVNLSQQNILPDSVRRFEQDIDEALIGDTRLFGRYTANLELTYGDEKTITDTITFWVIPYRLIGGIIAAIVIGSIIVWLMLKRYRRRILKQARRRRY